MSVKNLSSLAGLEHTFLGLVSSGRRMGTLLIELPQSTLRLMYFLIF